MSEQIKPVAHIQKDHLQKACLAPFLCRVTPDSRSDREAIYTAGQLARARREGMEEAARKFRENDAVYFLKELVDAMENSHISSWQTTAGWQKQLDEAADFLAAIAKERP